MPELPDRPLFTRLRVQNFRSLADVDLTLGPLTVLVGPNGAGKSNVVDALRFVRDALTRGLGQTVIDRDGIAMIQRQEPDGRSPDVVIQLTIEGGWWEVEYSFTIGAEGVSGFKVKQESFLLWYGGTDSVALRAYPKTILR